MSLGEGAAQRSACKHVKVVDGQTLQQRGEAQASTQLAGLSAHVILHLLLQAA
jgi:hypothetical protein